MASPCLLQRRQRKLMVVTDTAAVMADSVAATAAVVMVIEADGASVIAPMASDTAAMAMEVDTVTVDTVVPVPAATADTTRIRTATATRATVVAATDGKQLTRTRLPSP